MIFSAEEEYYYKLFELIAQYESGVRCGPSTVGEYSANIFTLDKDHYIYCNIVLGHLKQRRRILKIPEVKYNCVYLNDEFMFPSTIDGVKLHNDDDFPSDYYGQLIQFDLLDIDVSPSIYIGDENKKKLNLCCFPQLFDQIVDEKIRARLISSDEFEYSEEFVEEHRTILTRAFQIWEQYCKYSSTCNDDSDNDETVNIHSSTQSSALLPSVNTISAREELLQRIQFPPQYDFNEPREPIGFAHKYVEAVRPFLDKIYSIIMEQYDLFIQTNLLCDDNMFNTTVTIEDVVKRATVETKNEWVRMFVQDIAGPVEEVSNTANAFSHLFVTHRSSIFMSQQQLSANISLPIDVDRVQLKYTKDCIFYTYPPIKLLDQYMNKMVDIESCSLFASFKMDKGRYVYYGSLWPDVGTDSAASESLSTTDSDDVFTGYNITECLTHALNIFNDNVTICEQQMKLKQYSLNEYIQRLNKEKKLIVSSLCEKRRTITYDVSINNTICNVGVSPCVDQGTIHVSSDMVDAGLFMFVQRHFNCGIEVNDNTMLLSVGDQIILTPSNIITNEGESVSATTAATISATATIKSSSHKEAFIVSKICNSINKYDLLISPLDAAPGIIGFVNVFYYKQSVLTPIEGVSLDEEINVGEVPHVYHQNNKSGKNTQSNVDTVNNGVVVNSDVNEVTVSENVNNDDTATSHHNEQINTQWDWEFIDPTPEEQIKFFTIFNTLSSPWTELSYNLNVKKLYPSVPRYHINYLLKEKSGPHHKPNPDVILERVKQSVEIAAANEENVKTMNYNNNAKFTVGSDVTVIGMQPPIRYVVKGFNTDSMSTPDDYENMLYLIYNPLEANPRESTHHGSTLMHYLVDMNLPAFGGRGSGKSGRTLQKRKGVINIQDIVLMDQ